ncbi:MAG: GNAT family N-acetyltransferase [Clostridiales bacterium]
MGVITDPAYRHQGIAGQLMQFALSELTKTGYAAALLYTDIPKFYRPFGFTHHYGLRQIQITPTLTQVNAHWQERQINFSTIRDCSQVYQRMCTDFNGYILRNHQNWQILLEELQCDGGKIYVFNQEAYLLAYPEKENLIIREIGYTNQDTLFETLKLAQNLAITAEIPSLRWNAPLSAPLSAQFGGTTIPFVMACALGCHSYAAFTPQNWINEYT